MPDSMEFKVSSKAITAFRIGAWFLGLLVVMLLFPISRCCSDFNEETSLGTLAWFYGVVAVVLMGFILRTILLWRRVPPGAASGTIDINEDSISFNIAPHQRSLLWSEIKSAAPVAFLTGKHPVALWLSYEPNATPRSAIRARIEREIRKRPTTPIEGDQWLAFPLVLFGLDQTSRIIELARSRAGGTNTGLSVKD